MLLWMQTDATNESTMADGLMVDLMGAEDSYGERWEN